MKRKKVIAGNWKLNMNQAETKSFLNAIKNDLVQNDLKQVEVVICPSFTSLATAGQVIKDTGLAIVLGAQNVSQHKSGAYTGEVNTEMLQELGVTQVLVGHSERREYFTEEDSVINAKVKTVIAAGLNVILCCGESEATRESGKTDVWVSSQIEAGIAGLELNNFASRVTIAYEPIWAIGTGKVCDSAEANRVIKVIRAKLAALLGQSTADSTRILYGGSVKASNIEEILSQSDIDGALVGGASIKVDEFPALVKAAAKETASL